MNKKILYTKGSIYIKRTIVKKKKIKTKIINNK